MTRAALVVGYGNALRTDDGVGWHAAGLMSDDPRLDGAVVLQRHQLTPELSLDVSDAGVVVLVDASSAAPAGSLTITRVDPAEGSVASTSHVLVPATLAALAEELYGRVPEVWLVTCGVSSLEVGDCLSPEIATVLPLIVDAVVEILARQDIRTAAVEPAELAESHDA